MMVNGRPAPISRASNKDEVFGEGDYVVYPTHGVGKVEKIAKEEIAGHHLELIHITFEENRMTLRVPVSKARSAGLRRLSTRKMFDEALAVLKGRARIKRTMWSRRAQEYEAKINSGNPISIVYPEDGTLLSVGPSAILANAPHPNAARLFLEWLLSAEYAEACAEFYQEPVRADAPPMRGGKRLSEIKTINVSAAEIAKNLPEAVEQWRDTFGN